MSTKPSSSPDRDMAGQLDKSAAAITDLAKMVRTAAELKVGRTAQLKGRVSVSPVRPSDAGAEDSPPSRPVTSQRPVPSAVGRSVSDGKVTGPQQRILDSLAWAESVRIPSVDKVQLALLADASPKSSAYANNLGALRSSGLITKTGPVSLTDDGRGLAGEPDMPRTSEDLQEMLYRRLKSDPQVRILKVLVAAYPADVEREELAERAQASPTSSAFANNLGRLRSLGLIDYGAGRTVHALPVLFLEER